ncbi:hypothetical protein E2320_009378 [Naja naja]|nr:hypothetical protein E2320_009378 [Naja naja]
MAPRTPLPHNTPAAWLKETPWRKRTGDLGGGGDLPQLTELGTSLCGGFPAGGCEGRPDCGAAPGSSAPRPMGRREPRRLPAPIKGSGWRWGAEAAPMEWRRWSTGLSAAVLLMGLAFAQGLSCNRTEYQLNGRCCSRCPPGQKVATACSGQLNTSCIPCEEDHFQASWTKEFHCTQHRTCKQSSHLHDTLCAPCSLGFFSNVSSTTARCQPWSRCQEGQLQKAKGTQATDVTCETPPLKHHNDRKNYLLLKETPWRKRTGDLGGGGDLPQLTELGTSLCGGFPAGGCEGRPDCGAAPGSSAPRPMGRREPCLPAPIKGSGWRWGAEAAPMEWRRWSTGLSAAVLLMGLAFAQGLSCNRTEYQLNGRCCSRCPPGQKVATACSGQLNTSCIPCEEDHFQASWTKEFHCTQHRTCKQSSHLHDTLCAPCSLGFFSNVSSTTARCQPWSRCQEGQLQKAKGTQATDVTCETPPLKHHNDRKNYLLVLLPIAAFLLGGLLFLWRRHGRCPWKRHPDPSPEPTENEEECPTFPTQETLLGQQAGLQEKDCRLAQQEQV